MTITIGTFLSLYGDNVMVKTSSGPGTYSNYQDTFVRNIPMEDKGSKSLASFQLPMVKTQLITQLFLMRKYLVGEIDDTTSAYQLFWIPRRYPVNLCMAPSMPGHCP